MFSSDTNSELAAGSLLSLLKQHDNTRIRGGMAERQRGDNGLHMIYIREGNVRPFMKPSRAAKEEGGSVLASGWHGQGQHFCHRELKCYRGETSQAETLTARQQVCVGREETTSFEAAAVR